MEEGQEKVGRPDFTAGLTSLAGQQEGRRSLSLQGISEKGLGGMMGGPHSKATNRRDHQFAGWACHPAPDVLSY